MRRSFPFFLGFLTLFGAAVFASAQGVEPGEEGLLPPALGREAVELTADLVSYEHERELYEASGNVRIVQGSGRILTTDWLSLNSRTQVGVAVGNVRIRDGNDVIQAQFAAVDMRTLQIVSRKGKVESDLGIFEADVVERISDKEYRLRDGSFSACRCPPENERLPWQLDVKEATLEVGGYAKAKGITFRILDIPAFYIPWLIFPVKDSRQTGFLVPILGSGNRGGRSIEVPFFWAARDNISVTVRPTYFSERGVKTSTQVEYVVGEETEGEIGASYLPGDNQIADEERDGNLFFSENRWAGWWNHRQPLTKDLRFGAGVRHISDNQYPLDFEDLDGVWRNSRFLSSNIWVTGGRNGLYGGVEVTQFDDLNAPEDLDRDDFLLNRLPEVSLSALPRGFRDFPVRASLDFDYIYFKQRKNPAGSSLAGAAAAVNQQFFDTGLDGRFNAEETVNPDPMVLGPDEHLDDFGAPGRTEGDGFFQEGEPLADFGHRFDIHPRLSLPLQLGALETFSELGYRATTYAPDRGSSETRGLWTGRIDVRTRFIKPLTLANRSINHIVEPSATFGVISNESQSGNPLFVPNSGVRQRRLINHDLRGLLRNPSDRIREERILLGAIANHFYAPPAHDQTAPRHIGTLRIGGGYDYEVAEPTFLYGEASLTPNPNILVGARFGYDLKRSRSAESNVDIEWRTEPRYALASSVSERRHSVTFGYRYLRDVPDFYERWFRNDDVFEEFKEDFDRINQLNLDGNLALLRQIDVFFNGFISVEESSTVGGTVGIAFLSDCACWELIAQMQRRTRPDNTRFGIELRLAGLGFQKIKRTRPLVPSRLEDGSTRQR